MSHFKKQVYFIYSRLILRSSNYYIKGVLNRKSR
jgi:hypothetical protein